MKLQNPSPPMFSLEPDCNFTDNHSVSGEDEDPNLMYKCRFCGQSFAKSYELGGHMNSHRRGIMAVLYLLFIILL